MTAPADGSTIHAQTILSDDNFARLHNSRFREAAELTEEQAQAESALNGVESLTIFGAQNQRLSQCSIQDATDLGNLGMIAAHAEFDRCIFSGGSNWSDPHGAGYGRYKGIALVIASQVYLHRCLLTDFTSRLFNADRSFVSLTNCLIVGDGQFAQAFLENSAVQAINCIFVNADGPESLPAAYPLIIGPGNYDTVDQGVARRFYQRGNEFYGFPEGFILNRNPFCTDDTRDEDAPDDFFRTRPYPYTYNLNDVSTVWHSCLHTTGAEPLDTWDQAVIAATIAKLEALGITVPPA